MKRLWSVFTNDMDHCYFTGIAPVERHHIFGGNPNRKNSEKYGFVIPLAPDLHPNGVHAGKDAVDIDLKLKQMAQTYFEEHYGTRKNLEKFLESRGYRLKHLPQGKRNRSCRKPGSLVPMGARWKGEMIESVRDF